MMSRWLVGLLVGLVITVLVGCGEGPAEGVTATVAATPTTMVVEEATAVPLDIPLVDYESPNYAVTFQLPEAWIVNDNEDAITIRSNDAANPDVRIEMTLVPSALLGGGNLMELIEIGSESFAAQEGAEVLQEAAMTTFNNQRAAHTQVRGPNGEEKAFLEYIVVMSNTGDQAATIVAMTRESTEAENLPIVAAILNSIELLPITN
jgi:hypothetical protein